MLLDKFFCCFGLADKSGQMQRRKPIITKGLSEAWIVGQKRAQTRNVAKNGGLENVDKSPTYILSHR